MATAEEQALPCTLHPEAVSEGEDVPAGDEGEHPIPGEDGAQGRVSMHSSSRRSMSRLCAKACMPHHTMSLN